MRQLDIQGHRGARALFPENTIDGFLAAARLGVTAFELDVVMTQDGTVVVSHDPALNPDLTRDRQGRWLSGERRLIRTLTDAELASYDVGRCRPGSRVAALFPLQAACDGARIPSLASVLSALPSSRFTIEVKTDPRHPAWTPSAECLAAAVLAVIKAAGAMSRVMVEAFDWRVQRHLRRCCPELRLAWLTQAETVRDAHLWWDRTDLPCSVPACVAAEGGDVWAPDHTTLSQAEIEEAHALGLRVLPWTVNRPDDMVRLIRWGVDGLISDRPDVALAVAAGRTLDLRNVQKSDDLP